MPTTWDQERAERQQVRWDLLHEEYGGNQDTRLREWFTAMGDPEFANLLGVPDISGNLLVSVSTMLTSPGLYGMGAPRLLHQDVGGAAILSEALDQCGYWSRMQFVEFLTAGLGDALVALEVGEEGLRVRTVPPQDVWIETLPHDASQIRELRELRIRDVAGLGERYCWDAYRLPSKPGELPTFRILTNLETGPADVTRSVSLEVDLERDPYPWRYENNRPFIPYLRYARVDTGGVWHDSTRRGLTRAALNGILHWTYAGRSALDASHSSHVFAGLEPPSASTTTTPEGTLPLAPPVRTMRTLPGSMMFLHATEGGQPFHQEIGAGANLQTLLGFAVEYEKHALLREGISGEDYTSGPNPQSAGSMALSLATRRRVAERVRPLFRRRDLEAVSMAAAMLRAAGLPSGPERGYVLEYLTIPASIDEAAAERDAMSWRREQKLVSRVDLYVHDHPGVSRALAVAELRRIDEEDAALSAAAPKQVPAVPMNPDAEPEMPDAPAPSTN